MMMTRRRIFSSERGSLRYLPIYLTISAHSSFLDFHINIATSLFEDDNLSKVNFAQVKNAKEPFEYKKVKRQKNTPADKKHKRSKNW